jgi:hypothetical protein
MGLKRIRGGVEYNPVNHRPSSGTVQLCGEFFGQVAIQLHLSGKRCIRVASGIAIDAGELTASGNVERIGIAQTPKLRFGQNPALAIRLD